jgi:hypothetical protein
MPERIFLTYTNATAVPYEGSTLGHHIVLNYIDANGNHYTLQGVPKHPTNTILISLVRFTSRKYCLMV